MAAVGAAEGAHFLCNCAGDARLILGGRITFVTLTLGALDIEQRSP